MPWNLIVDSVVAVLLVVTISFTITLNRRLGNLRRDRSELEKMAASFQQATVRAEDSIGKLKITTEALQERIDKAQGLSDDLAFLIDRGNAAADKLEEKVRVARRDVEAAPAAAAETAPPAPARPAPTPRVVTSTDRPAPVLRAGPPKPAATEARSDAERELLRALQAAR